MEHKYILNTPNYYRELFIDDKKRPVVLIAPGGGYKYTSERESEPVAKFYNKHGFHAVIVNYRETVNDLYPKTSEYLAEAMKIIKNDKTYPVVTSDERYSHSESFKNLLGDGYNNKELMNYVSLETQVKEDAPDLFLFGTFTDESVNVMNSLLLLEAYKKANCNAEYHSFPMGGHGLSLGTEETADNKPEKIVPYYQAWADYSVKWINYKLNK